MNYEGLDLAFCVLAGLREALAAGFFKEADGIRDSISLRSRSRKRWSCSAEGRAVR
jgi:hypothetical protein